MPLPGKGIVVWCLQKQHTHPGLLAVTIRDPHADVCAETIISGGRELAVDCAGLSFQLNPPLSDQILALVQQLAWIRVVISAGAQLITNTNTFAQ